MTGRREGGRVGGNEKKREWGVGESRDTQYNDSVMCAYVYYICM